MGLNKVPVTNIRFPENVKERLKEISQETGVPIVELVITAVCNEYKIRGPGMQVEAG